MSETAQQLRAEIERLRGLLNTPELIDFARAVQLEGAHQRERWGTDHDAGKTPADWFWLVGYLAGKALHEHLAGNTDKALHHVITTAAALANWHAAILGLTNMRPGIEPPSADVRDLVTHPSIVREVCEDHPADRIAGTKPVLP